MYNKLNNEQALWVDKIFSTMTLAEKIGQLVCENNSDFHLRVNDMEEWLRKYPVGNLFVGAEVIDTSSSRQEELSRAIKLLKKLSRIPASICGDFERGIGGSIQGNFTSLPDLMALSATNDPHLAYEYGRIIAEEGRLLGLNWAFGPVSDLNLNHENPVSNVRTAGDNADHVIKMLTKLIKGMEENGCASCPKHFPGDGTDTRNQHYVTSFNTLSKEEWDKQHGRVFKALIDAGAMSMMIGHIAFPAYEKINAKKGIFCPATASKKIMTDLLRGELGFKGIILSDALSMQGFHSWGEYEERILDSFNGGTDIFLWPETEKFFKLMTAALSDGRAAMTRLNDSVKRILSFKALLGLNEKEQVKLKPSPTAIFENKTISRRMAEKSVTVLRNRTDNIPLDLPKKSKILILNTPDNSIGASKCTYFYNELIKRDYNVTFSKFSAFHDLSGVIDQFDAVILLCHAHPNFSEYRGFHREIWSFMNNRSIKKRIVISLGTPYFLYDLASVDTYINSYSLSPDSQEAVIRVLFGELPAIGKSPVGIKNCFEFGDGLKTFI